MEKDSLFSKHRKYQNLWTNNKGRGDSKCNLFAFCIKFEFLISKGSNNMLRRGGQCHLVFVINFLRFPAVQKNGNRLRFDKVTDSQKVGTFLRHSVGLVVGVSQTAALNRGLHLYSTGRLSRWALAHISSCKFITASNR